MSLLEGLGHADLDRLNALPGILVFGVQWHNLE
jgi:hypothetical protein